MIRLLLLVSIFVVQTAFCTSLRLTEVAQPLYLHGSDTDPVISFQDVPFVTSTSDPEWRFGAIAVPCVPSTDSASGAGDINITSVYKIRVTGTYAYDNKELVVTIDASDAEVPDGYPFTMEQAIDAVETCVKIMYPQRPPDEGSLRIIHVLPRPGDSSETIGDSPNEMRAAPGNKNLNAAQSTH